MYLAVVLLYVDYCYHNDNFVDAAYVVEIYYYYYDLIDYKYIDFDLIVDVVFVVDDDVDNDMFVAVRMGLVP